MPLECKLVKILGMSLAAICNRIVAGLRTLCVQMKESSDFLKRREEVTEFNKKHKWLKRGISMTHCRYAFCRRPPFTHLS